MKIAEQESLEMILRWINESIEELSIHGRFPSNGPLRSEWHHLWMHLTNIKERLSELADFKSKIKAFVIEEIAKEILVPHGIDLKRIIEKYECDDC